MNLPKNLTFLTHFVSHLRYGQQLHPVRDWFVVLSLLVVLLVASIVWNVIFFFQVMNGVGVAPSGDAVQASSTDPVKTTQEIFIKRQIEEARYENEYRFVDPSR